MSFKRIERAVDFLERLGLTEDDIDIYALLLDSPPLSVGEIQQTITRLEILEVGASLRDLSDLGLVGVTDGYYKRYYAKLPFLRESVTVERETIFSLNSLMTSIDEKRNEISKRTEMVESVTLPTFTESVLNTYGEKFVKPMQTKLPLVEEVVGEAKLNALRQFQKLSDAVSNTLETNIPSTEESVSKSKEAIAVVVRKAVDSLNSGIEGLKQGVEESLGSSHKEISAKILTLKSGIEKISRSASGAAEQVLISADALMNHVKSLEEFLKSLKSYVSEMDKAKTEILSAVITSRENLVSRIPEVTNGITQSQVREAMKDLTETIQTIEVAPLDPLITGLEEGISQAHPMRVDVGNSVENFRGEVDELSGGMVESVATIAKSISEVLSKTHSTVMDSVEATADVTTLQLEGTTAKVQENLDGIVSGLQNSVDKSNKELEESLSVFEQLLTDAFDAPSEVIKAAQDLLVDVTDEEKENFLKLTEEHVTNLVKEIRSAEEGNIGLLKERIKFAIAMLEGRGADLRAILHMSNSYTIKRAVNTGIVLGLPSIYASLSDMVLRSKRQVTIVIPSFDDTLFNLSASRRTHRTIIVTKLPEKRRDAIIEKAKDLGNISIIEYTNGDIIACFKDKEEIIFGFVLQGEEWTAVRSVQDSMISLFEDRFNEVVIRRSKKLT